MFPGQITIHATALIALFASVPATLTAQRVSFAHPDGTTHRYEPIATPLGITWAAASRAAATAGGYLATITSKEENAAVFKAIDDPKYWSTSPTSAAGPWFGGLQFPGSTEPAGGWVWSELEASTYTNWAAGLPDNASGADRMRFGGQKIGATWADSPATAKMPGYIIEYSGPTAARTLGLKMSAAASEDGYTMISPKNRGDTYLVDPRGRVVNQWW